MAKLVGAFCTSHVLLERRGVEAQADRVFDGMLEIRRQIDALDPHIVVLVGDDHFINFDLAYEIPFAIPVQDVMMSCGDAGLPVVPFNGDPAFSGGLRDYLNGNGFDIAALREYKLCHGFTTPAFFTAPRKTKRIAPVVTNAMMEPPLDPKRCYELGRRIGEYIRNVRPADERVVIVGTGGLTHWVGLEPSGRMNFDFDRKVLDLFGAGKSEELTRMTGQQIIDIAGNGGIEVANWIVVGGATHGRPARTIYYESMPEWWTGMSGIQIAV
jgi:2'-aminobiphenyl-2,3-diol 1,2-dioxygenase, large subunit